MLFRCYLSFLVVFQDCRGDFMIDNINLTAVDEIVDQVSIASQVLAGFVTSMPTYFQVCLGLSVIGMFVRIFYELYR